jgi:hypothetical protein
LTGKLAQDEPTDEPTWVNDSVLQLPNETAPPNIQRAAMSNIE